MDNTIPLEFIRRAHQHLKATGEPLLEYRFDDSEYDTTVDAIPGSYGYRLEISGLEPPFSTWREYMKHHGWKKGKMRRWAEEGGYFAPPEKDEVEANVDTNAAFNKWLDEEVEDAYAYVEPRETETGTVYSMLEDIDTDFTVVGSAEGAPSLEDFDLGEIQFVEGDRPGSDLTFVSATSGLALSCLQYILDEQKAGIQIIL